MALSRTIDTPWGIKVSNAYCRIETVWIDTKTSISFLVRAYVDSNTNTYFDEQRSACQYSIDGDNPIKQAYEYLKTLPEFADATDC